MKLDCFIDLLSVFSSDLYKWLDGAKSRDEIRAYLFKYFIEQTSRFQEPELFKDENDE